jgi:2-dehydropantoate 2-reductase
LKGTVAAGVAKHFSPLMLAVVLQVRGAPGIFRAMNPSDLKIAVVGSGAVGCYYGGMLAHAGCDVRFLMRADLAAVKERGLTIHTHGETVEVPKVAAFGSTAEIGPVDLVIIGLKATNNSALHELVPPLLGEKTALLTLQNGLGNEEYLATRWGEERVMGGLCFVCLNRTAPGVIDHFDAGSISIGEFRRPAGDRVRVIVEAFARAGIESRAVENLVTERWRKLLWNIPFNGLSIAAHGATVADVLADDGLRKLARDLMDEALDAARRLGHEIPDAFADYQIERSYAMKRYKPSSMIDWQEGRPVEIEAIWGEPLRQGLSVGASMPRLEMLYHLLRRITA